VTIKKFELFLLKPRTLRLVVHKYTYLVGMYLLYYSE